MILETKKRETLNEYLTREHDLYNGCYSYAWSEQHQQWRSHEIDEATRDLISEWFGIRNVCDPDNFARFFRRKYNSCALRYAQLYRIELSSFDPLVADYIESESKGESSRTHTDNKTGNESGNSTITEGKTSSGNKTTTPSTVEETTGLRTPDLTESEQGVRTPALVKQSTETRTPELTETDTTTRTPQLTEETSGNRQSTNNKTMGGADTVHGETDVESIAKSGDKIAPQSISYEGQAANNGEGPGQYKRLPGYDWQYMSAQKQADTATHDETDSRTDYGQTETGSEGETSGQTVRKTGSEQTTGTKTTGGTERVVGRVDETGAENTTGSKRTTGREQTSERRTTTGQEQQTDSKTESGNRSVSDTKTFGETNIGNESGNDRRREIRTGRHGLTPQEAFSRASNYLKTSHAWEWLYKELDECFLSVYDI